MHHPASYPHQATRADVRIPLPDGAELSGRLWRPVTEQPVPAVLEYCADRLGDATVERDAQRHPWYAGHGYASLRVDARGWGSSGGVPGPEGGETEPADGLAVLDWLAAQPWCDGRIGLLGLGDGATTALRLAAQGPAAVAAVVAVCPSDDRYGEHYLGGSVRAAELPAAATARLAAAACPPDPVRVGEDWRRQWLDRLAELQPPLHGRLAHQTRDAFWAEAPLTAITAPVLAVAGWAGPGADTVLRLLERLTAPAFGIIGPWRHGYPDQGDPGPAIGFLQETLRWWDHWLRRQDTGMPAEPRLRSWLATPGESDAGHWIGDESWPSDDVREIHYDLTEALRTAGTPAGERFVTVRSPQQTGADAPWHGRPVDQRAEDGRSVCFDSAPLSEPLVLLGRPAVRLRVRLPGGVTGGQLAARLCDVAPDGSSVPITRGALNLAARRGTDLAVAWPPDAVEEVAFDLAATGHALAVGHRLRLALSSAYWPLVWPQPATQGVLVDPGHGALTLPVRHLAADVGRPPVVFAEPEQAAPPPVRRTSPVAPRPERVLKQFTATGQWRVELAPHQGGAVTLPDGLVRAEEAREYYRIQQHDPLAAAVHCDWSIRLERPELGWDVTVRAGTELDCDADAFTARSRLTAWEGGAVLFERDWERRIPRTGG
ncbi:putative CocE/NonD family hydrolase [Kitasatospora sp. GP30]|uniref:CocE/NonD family hydrolase n=1 Tax=Kitasatospora sp. GP30 TaxID=3035084 RepID=UPI000C711F41|nr:CocE/NonD family hydrolase [Kitasatospora sp. GP30]MDH6139478.1 putative CocE/NonD family hydrolase [Kitasatospora sp. GP30]